MTTVPYGWHPDLQLWQEPGGWTWVGPCVVVQRPQVVQLYCAAYPAGLGIEGSRVRRGPPLARLTVAQISAATCGYMGVDPSELHEPGRTAPVVFARQITWYLCRRYVRPTPSYPELGRMFYRDHSTVLHGVRKVRDTASTSRVRRALTEIVRILQSRQQGP